jgi:hypothetical protein
MLISPCRKGRHNQQHVSYYGSNKVDQFRTIIPKNAFLIIAKLTTSAVIKLCRVKLHDVMEYNVAMQNFPCPRHADV